MSALKFVVVGLGLGKAWAKLIHEAPEFELAGLVDVDRARLDELSDQYGVPASARFTDFERALVEAEADALVIVTPPAAHKGMVLTGLEAGYHVLSEKPLAASIGEAREMARAIGKARRKFMVSQNYRWQDTVEAVRQAIAEGAVGRPGYITAAFHKGVRFGGWREQLPEVLLEDMSIHHFDLMRHLTGRNCQRLYARSFRPEWSWFSGNPAACAVLEMEGGLVVSYFGSWVSRGREMAWAGEYRIVGDRGAIHWDGTGATLVVGKPEDNPKDPKLESTALPSRPLAHTGFAYSLYEFARAIQDDREPVTGIADNIQSFAMTMAAIESARTGQPVDVQAFIAGG
ncbi:MAG: Gfo/Idh/MocA family oxidoreductase [Chloroflexi bacterium]|nr:Gfo/Idh/MocA family oxidoreductase [Chloroflexota bacterium]